MIIRKVGGLGEGFFVLLLLLDWRDGSNCKNLNLSTKSICGYIFFSWFIGDFEVELLRVFDPLPLLHVEIYLGEYSFMFL